jgi:hypothetical protein
LTSSETQLAAPPRSDLAARADFGLNGVYEVKSTLPAWTYFVALDALESREDLLPRFDQWGELAIAFTPLPRDWNVSEHNWNARDFWANVASPAPLLSQPTSVLASDNPAQDLHSWLTGSGGIAVKRIAAACGVSERGFYDWLKGAGIRERRAQRVHQFRAIAQALMLRLGRKGAIAWLVTPQLELSFVSPMDLLAEGRYGEVATALQEALPRKLAPKSGPMIAQDVEGDFDTRAMEEASGIERPLRRGRRIPAE